MPSKEPGRDAARESRERAPATRGGDHPAEEAVAVQPAPLGAGLLTPGTVLGLQRTAGNRAVVQLLRDAPGGAMLQREAAPTGLAAELPTTGFASSVHSFWTNADQNKPLQALSDFAMGMINALVPYPCKWAYTGGSAAGLFKRTIWTIELNTAQFTERQGVSKLGDLTQEEVAGMVSTIYHEARHSEQAFQIARVQAGEGKTAQQIEADLSIPADVAAAAVARKLVGGKGSGNEEAVAEAKKWEVTTSGTYAQYSDEVALLLYEVLALDPVLDAAESHAAAIGGLAGPLATIATRMTGFFAQEQARIEALDKKTGMDTAVLRRIQGFQSAWNALKKGYAVQKADKSKFDLFALMSLRDDLHGVVYDAYRAHAEERDAWAVGGAAGEAVRGLGAQSPSEAE